MSRRALSLEQIFDAHLRVLATTLRYQLLEMKKFKDAIRILELNVEAYPLSADV